MTEVWNAKKHDIRIEEHTDADLNYIAEIICDGKMVYHMEKPITNRFSVMRVHNEFLQILEEYEKSGRLPSRAGRFMKKRHL